MTSLQNIPPRAPGDPRATREPGNAVQTFAVNGRQEENDPLVDLKLVRDLSRFVLNACRRRKKLVRLIFGSFVVAGSLSVFLLPKTYYTETKLLADRNVVMPLLGNPMRRMADEADTPTRLASELIMTRSNLEGIVKSADLIAESDRKRSPLSKLKQRFREYRKGPQTADERMDDMIWNLRTKMNVKVGDGTVVIGVVWTDPDDAYRIVQAAQQSFLEERQTQEVTLIQGSINILEKRALQVQNDITGMLDTLSRQRVALTPEDAKPFLPATPRTAAPSADLLATQSSLDATVRSISDLEQFRNRRMAELQSTLAEQRNIYGAAHPQIENTEQLIKSMQTDSPQLAQLKAEEQRLRAKLARLGGSASEGVSAQALNDQTLAAAALRNMVTMRSDSIVQEKQQYGRSRLRIAMTSYQALLERLDAARIELQTVRATFKFKYGVLIPANVPKDALGTKPAVVVVGACVLGVILSILTAVALDLAAGRVLEAWQIERTLGLTVLGEAPLV